MRRTSRTGNATHKPFLGDACRIMSSKDMNLMTMIMMIIENDDGEDDGSVNHADEDEDEEEEDRYSNSRVIQKWPLKRK